MQLHRNDNMPHAVAAMPGGCQQSVKECIGSCNVCWSCPVLRLMSLGHAGRNVTLEQDPASEIRVADLHLDAAKAFWTQNCQLRMFSSALIPQGVRWSKPALSALPPVMSLGTCFCFGRSALAHML
jgi:hypothetical protein